MLAYTVLRKNTTLFFWLTTCCLFPLWCFVKFKLIHLFLSRFLYCPSQHCGVQGHTFGILHTWVIVPTLTHLRLILGMSQGFSGDARGKEPACQRRRCMRPRLNPWIGKVPWRRGWQPTPVFFLGESHGQRTWWATVHGVAQSWTRLKRLSSHAQVQE